MSRGGRERAWLCGLCVLVQLQWGTADPGASVEIPCDTAGIQPVCAERAGCSWDEPASKCISQRDTPDQSDSDDDEDDDDFATGPDKGDDSLLAGAGGDSGGGGYDLGEPLSDATEGDFGKGAGQEPPETATSGEVQFPQASVQDATGVREEWGGKAEAGPVGEVVTTPEVLHSELDGFANMTAEDRQQQMWNFLGKDDFNNQVEKWKSQPEASKQQQLRLMNQFLKQNPELGEQVAAFHKFFSRDQETISKEIMEGMMSHLGKVGGMMPPGGGAPAPSMPIPVSIAGGPSKAAPSVNDNHLAPPASDTANSPPSPTMHQHHATMNPQSTSEPSSVTPATLFSAPSLPAHRSRHIQPNPSLGQSAWPTHLPLPGFNGQFGVGMMMPGAGMMAPGAGMMMPGAGMMAPGAGMMMPGAGMMAPGTGLQYPGTQYPGMRYPVGGYGNDVLANPQAHFGLDASRAMQMFLPRFQ